MSPSCFIFLCGYLSLFLAGTCLFEFAEGQGEPWGARARTLEYSLSNPSAGFRLGQIRVHVRIVRQNCHYSTGEYRTCVVRELFSVV